MSYDPSEERIIIDTDPLRGDGEEELRRRRLTELRLTDRPNDRLDRFAAQLASEAGELVDLSTPDAMVNLFIGGRQYFVGLHLAAHNGPTGNTLRQASSPGREMPRTEGWCPHVIARKLPLVLNDTCARPRFAANPVVGSLGIRSYLGAPIIDPETDVALGTVCVVSRDVRPYGRQGLEFIKKQARDAFTLLSSLHASPSPSM